MGTEFDFDGGERGQYFEIEDTHVILTARLNRTPQPNLSTTHAVFAQYSSSVMESLQQLQ